MGDSNSFLKIVNQGMDFMYFDLFIKKKFSEARNSAKNFCLPIKWVYVLYLAVRHSSNSQIKKNFFFHKMYYNQYIYISFLTNHSYYPHFEVFKTKLRFVYTVRHFVLSWSLNKCKIEFTSQRLPKRTGSKSRFIIESNVTIAVTFD